MQKCNIKKGDFVKRNSKWAKAHPHSKLLSRKLRVTSVNGDIVNTVDDNLSDWDRYNSFHYSYLEKAN